MATLTVATPSKVPLTYSVTPGTREGLRDVVKLSYLQPLFKACGYTPPPNQVSYLNSIQNIDSNRLDYKVVEYLGGTSKADYPKGQPVGLKELLQDILAHAASLKVRNHKGFTVAIVLTYSLSRVPSMPY